MGMVSHGVKTLIVIIALVFSACGEQSNTVVSIALHPTNPNILYVATDEAVYKSRDGGVLWSRLNGELSRTGVITLAVDPLLPANVFAGTMADGAYKSPDGGRRWLPYNQGMQKGTISTNVNQLVFNPRGSDTIYAATTTGVFRTTDGGRTWVERMSGMTEISFIVTLAVDPLQPNVVYAGTSGGVYRSHDATESWKKVNTGLVPPDAKMVSMALGVNALAVDPIVSSTVYAGTTRGVFKTTDGGDSWVRIGQSLGEVYVSGLAIHSTKTNILYAATSAGVHKSLDKGESWDVMNNGLETLSIRVIKMNPQDSETLYVGTNRGGLYRSTDGAQTWTRQLLSVQAIGQTS